jgi:hypothetical protein
MTFDQSSFNSPNSVPMSAVEVAPPSEQERFLELAAYLQQVRLQQGLKITDVAHLSLLPPQLIQAIEAGDLQSLPASLPSGVCIQRYADALGRVIN